MDELNLVARLALSEWLSEWQQGWLLAAIGGGGVDELAEDMVDFFDIYEANAEEARP